MPGVFDVTGAAGTGTTVTVNGSSAGVTRHGEYFFKGQTMANNPNPVFSNLSVYDGTTYNVPAFTAGTPEPFTYDDDGNQTADGRWTYTYDGENRPDTAETNAGAVSAGAPRQKLTFSYDYLGRRVSKVVQSGWNGSIYTVTDFSRRFMHDGWNLIAAIDLLVGGNPIVAHYYRGLDLSGHRQGAGGIGGLLLAQEAGNSYLPAYDALGNLHAMIKASDGSLAAEYEYDAFGNTLRESGPYAASNPLRFSTKYTDTETGLADYGLRYYSPTLGRFINRDPIAEQGGLNLYGFVGNNGVNRWDYLGMKVRYSAPVFRGKLQLGGHGSVRYQLLTEQQAGETEMQAPTQHQIMNNLEAEIRQQAAQPVTDPLAVLAAIMRPLSGPTLGDIGGIEAIAASILSMNEVGADNGYFAPAPNSAAIQSPVATSGNTPGALGTSYLLNQSFNNERSAAVAAANLMRSAIGDGLKTWEYGAGIYRLIEATTDGTHYETSYRVTPITPGLESASERLMWYARGNPISEALNPLFTSIINGTTPGATMVAYIHSHPVGSDRFSTGDLDFALLFRVNAYVLTHGAGLLTTPYKQIDWPPTAENLRGTPVSGVSKTPGDPRN